MPGYKESSANYRIVAIGEQFQPEMYYQCRIGFSWVPLNAEGYWANPSDFSRNSNEELMKPSLMTKEAAERSIWRAQKINRGIAA